MAAESGITARLITTSLVATAMPPLVMIEGARMPGCACEFYSIHVRRTLRVCSC